MLKYKAVLFDLDGTINDSGPGIMNSARYALEKMGYPVPGEETLRRFVGPSLIYSFRTFCGMNEEDAQQAVVWYRACYTGGEDYNLTIYDGMVSLFETLRGRGALLAVVTSKPQDMAEKILTHFGLRGYFDCVAGRDMENESSQKCQLILRALQELNISPREAVMVGDTRYDIIGAREAGCDSIGVTYGYGTKEELLEQKATYLAGCAREIGACAGLHF